MAKPIEFDVDMVGLASEMTIQVTYKRVREMRIRMWIATRLIMLAGLVTGMGIEFESGMSPEVDDGDN